MCGIEIVNYSSIPARKRRRPLASFSMKTIILKFRQFNWGITPLLRFLLLIAISLVKLAPVSAMQLSMNHPAQLTDTLKKRLIIEYHSNGKVSAKGYHGHYANKEISTDYYLGTWYYYNRDGILHRSIYYHNDVPSKAFILQKDYYPNGKLKSIKKYNNYDLYQTERKRLGKWQYFDPNGKPIQTVRY